VGPSVIVYSTFHTSVCRKNRVNFSGLNVNKFYNMKIGRKAE